MAEAPKARRKIPTWYYVAGAGGLVVAYYIYNARKKNAAASAAAANATGGAGSAVAPVAAGSYDTNGQDALAAYLANMQNSSTASATTAAAPTVNTTLAAGQKVGPGGGITDYGNAPITSNGFTYEPFASGASIAPYVAGGGTPYYEPAPGVFAPAPKNYTGFQYVQVPA